MDIQVDFGEGPDEERRARRRQRINEMKLHKQKQMRIRRYFRIAAPAAAGVVLLVSAFIIFTPKKAAPNASQDVEGGIEAESVILTKNEIRTENESHTESEDHTENESDILSEDTQTDPSDNGSKAPLLAEDFSGSSISAVLSDSIRQIKTLSAKETENTRQIGEEIASSYAVVINLDNNTIAAEKRAKERMNPASMTKILTVLVAAEQMGNSREKLDDPFTITLDITDYSYVHQCSNAGFGRDETVSVKDLFYGTILPSGADAALGLAIYTAGSQEAFVELMNQKLEELNLSDTAHVTNCIGLYDENHYCTVYDMAVILRAALANDLCREVLSAHTYTTSETEQHPEGITVSNWFLRRIEDKDTSGEVICGKTGYVVQSDHCAASYYESVDGEKYICVTAGASSPWRCIYDQVELYQNFRA